MGAVSEVAAGWILFGLLAAPVALALPVAALRRSPLLWGLPLLLMLLEIALLGWLGASPETVTWSLEWIPSRGVALAFALDGLAWAMGLLLLAAAALVFAFSATYLPLDLEERGCSRRPGTFYAILLFFTGSMLGLLCADDLITLYVFWEGTTVASFLLIAFHMQERESRNAGLHSWVLTGGSSLFFFVSILCLWQVGGSPSISTLLSLPEGWLADSPWHWLVAGGFVLGAISKSAQVPLHGWLPAAMVAPTPVSAFLHSATLVAAGVFLLTRFASLFSPIPFYETLLVGVGCLTIFTGGVVALRKTGMKQILAWSTISQYGYILVLLAIRAYGPAVFWILHHAVAKAGLFLAAGAVHATTGAHDTRDAPRGAHTRPLAFAITAVLALGLAGLPLTAGFWMKEVFFVEVDAQHLPWLTATSILVSGLTVTYFVRYLWLLYFFGEQPGPDGAPKKSKTPPLPLWLPSAACATWMLVVGLLPSWGTRFSDAGAAGALLHPVHTSMHLSLSPPLLYSLVSVALGVALFAWLRPSHIARWTTAAPVASPYRSLAKVLRRYGPGRVLSWLMSALVSGGRILGRLQTGKLYHALSALVAVPILAGVVLLLQVETWAPFPTAERWEGKGLPITGLAIAAAFLALGSVIVQSHIGAVLMVGGLGFLLALIFALLGGPDVALVQTVVETATSLLLLAALSRIPEPIRKRGLEASRQRRPGVGEGVVALSVALGFLAFCFTLALPPAMGGSELADEFLRLTTAEGVDSAVKEILVHFRAMDSLGEATVFGAAVVGSTLLLAGRRLRYPDG